MRVSEPVSMEEVYSKSSLLRSAKKCSIQIEVYGWRRSKTNSIPTLIPMQRKVRVIHVDECRSQSTAHSLNWFRFLGRILGKAMYEGILVDVAFADFFLAKVCLSYSDASQYLTISQWLGKQSYLDDLASLDPDLYNGLVFLKHYTGDLEDLALNFTVAVDGQLQKKTLSRTLLIFEQSSVWQLPST